MNFQQLTHLLALMETGSFSLAAERVHLTQPALSRSIRALEEEVGGPLIERLRKKKELTPLGVMVAKRARRIALEIAEIKRSADVISQSGTVRLGLGPTPAALLSRSLMKHVVNRYPSIRLLLSSGSREAQHQALLERSVDALIVHRNAVAPNEDLSISLFPKMRLTFLCRRRHPLASARSIDTAKLWSYPVAASGSGLSNEMLHNLNEQFGQSINFADVVQLQSDDTTSLLTTISNSNAIFFGVREVARSMLESGELVELRLDPPIQHTSQFAFVTLAGITETPPLKVIRQFCEAQMRDE